ncbi:MAG: hypothetical protein IJ093_00490 [Bacilli bacterium]|nr:hypothetical protein [Bacilli bacterium]
MSETKENDYLEVSSINKIVSSAVEIYAENPECEKESFLKAIVDVLNENSEEYQELSVLTNQIKTRDEKIQLRKQELAECSESLNIKHQEISKIIETAIQKTNELLSLKESQISDFVHEELYRAFVEVEVETLMLEKGLILPEEDKEEIDIDPYTFKIKK